MCETPDNPEPDPVLLAGRLAKCDLVLAVGFDNLPLPGIEVMRADNPVEPLYKRDMHIQAVVTDGVPPSGMLFSFAHDDIENIAAHILDRAILLPPLTDDRLAPAH